MALPQGSGSDQEAEGELDPPPLSSMEVIDGMAVADAIAQIHRSLDEKDILEATVQGLRLLLAADRVCILQFERNILGAPGQFVAEAVTAPWRSLLGMELKDPDQSLGSTIPYGESAHVQSRQSPGGQHAQILISDVSQAELTPEQRQFLMETCQARAILSVPLIRQSQLWGVLYLQYCDAPHGWSPQELTLLDQVLAQMAIALSHSAQLQQSQRQALQALQQLERLKETQAQLIHSEKMSGLGHLVAGIAHEINNPVSFIYGNLVHTGNYANTLLDVIRQYSEKFPDDELAAVLENIDFDFISMDFPKILDSMKTGTDRIRRLVLSLRNFARLDEADVKTVDIHEGIDNTLMVLRHRFVNREFLPTIRLRKNYGELPAVTCHPSQMNQVFLHLVTNAIDAFDDARRQAPYTPLIEITTTLLNDDRIAITVKDNGPGISKEIQRKIFDTFFTTKAPGQGTGLGLAISHHIVVEQHGGELICISELGWGSFFQVIIPVTPSVPLRHR